MRTRDKRVLWQFLGGKASKSLEKERQGLAQLETEINSIGLNIEKMCDMKKLYLQSLASDSQKKLPANRVRLIQTFIHRLDEATRIASEQKENLERQSALIRSRCIQYRIEEQKYASLYDKNILELRELDKSLEQKESDHLSQSRWFHSRKDSTFG